MDPIAGVGQAARIFAVGGDHRCQENFGMVAVTVVLFNELAELLGGRVAGRTGVGESDEFPGGAFVLVGCEVLGHEGLSGKGKLQARVTTAERRSASRVADTFVFSGVSARDPTFMSYVSRCVRRILRHQVPRRTVRTVLVDDGPGGHLDPRNRLSRLSADRSASPLPTSPPRVGEAYRFMP